MRYSLIPSGITTDIIGNPRIFQLAVDIGAYEMLYAPPVTSIRKSEY